MGIMILISPIIIICLCPTKSKIGNVQEQFPAELQTHPTLPSTKFTVILRIP